MTNIPPILWKPSYERQTQSSLTAYLHWLAQHRKLSFQNYDQLWHWSVTHSEDFWASLWEFFQIQSSTPYQWVMSGTQMPDINWFGGAQLNFAQHIFRNATPDRPALLFQSEWRPLTELSWDQLSTQVAAVAAALRRLGIQSGDRVAAYMSNIPEAVIALLACASIGAIWSSCSPDFGVPSVVDRWKQIEPTALFAIDGYIYGGKTFDRRPAIHELQQALPSLQTIVLIPYLYPEEPATQFHHTITWQELIATPAPLEFELVPFEHPLWILYSSGTTGLPKPIVQGHGGILLEHFKSLALHLDLHPSDRFFWFTTTGWMMWNFLLGGLLIGCTILLYDGSPAYPDLTVLWQFAEQTQMNFFGTSAAYITTCLKAGLTPSTHYNISQIKGVGSTASPLPPEGFDWVYTHVNPDLMLASISGGTDVCTAFVGSCPLLPVYRGELQCRWLGASVQAFDEHGQALIDQVGEFVVTKPMPSMPLCFWNDSNNQRYRESYFSMYPAVWRHGDWIEITSRGSLIIYGRSDSTINRLGIRMGTSEIYRIVEALPEIQDSLVVDLTLPNKTAYMPLFVVLAPGISLDTDLVTKIKTHIRLSLSPRHVPDDVFVINGVPYTLSGKKLEIPVKRILMGLPIDQVANPDAMRNPSALEPFLELAERLQK